MNNYLLSKQLSRFLEKKKKKTNREEKQEEAHGWASSAKHFGGSINQVHHKLLRRLPSLNYQN